MAHFFEMAEQILVFSALWIFMIIDAIWLFYMIVSLAEKIIHDRKNENYMTFNVPTTNTPKEENENE